jgi:hypothetical protein
LESGTISALWGNHSEAVVAAVALVVSLVSAFMASRANRTAQQLQTEALSMEVDRACLEWGHEAIDAMAEARALVDAPQAFGSQLEFEKARASLSGRLSGLADRGRLFFLNYDPDEPQPDTESAYQGSRPAILFPLILAHYELEAIRSVIPTDTKALSQFMFECRRLFVSELQDYVDPARRQAASRREDPRFGANRAPAMRRAAELALDIELRRPGLLMQFRDQGILDRIPAEERKQRLQDAQRRETP